MPMVGLGLDATSRAAQQSKDWRVLRSVERTRQQIQVALDEIGDGRAACGRIALCAANDLFIHAQRQLWHIRMIPQIYT